VLNLFKCVAVDADKCASWKEVPRLSALALEFRKLQNSQGVLRAPVASAFAIANSVSAEPMRNEKNPDDLGKSDLDFLRDWTKKRQQHRQRSTMFPLN